MEKEDFTRSVLTEKSLFLKFVIKLWYEIFKKVFKRKEKEKQKLRRSRRTFNIVGKLDFSSDILTYYGSYLIV